MCIIRLKAPQIQGLNIWFAYENQVATEEKWHFIVEGKGEIEAFNAAGKNFEEIYFSQSLANEISSSSILSSLLERVPFRVVGGCYQ